MTDDAHGLQPAPNVLTEKPPRSARGPTKVEDFRIQCLTNLLNHLA